MYQKARLMKDEGRLEEAAALFQQSVTPSPHSKFLELLGEGLIRLGRTQGAIVPLAAAVCLNRGVGAPSMLAEVFLRLDDPEAAAEMAKLC
jgi:hypothetical protein